MSFDASRARLKGPDLFQRWQIRDGGVRLADAGLPLDDELVVAEVDGDRRAVRILDISHPHGCELRLAGKLRYVSW